MNPYIAALMMGIQAIAPMLSQQENVNLNPYTDDQLAALKKQIAEAMSQYQSGQNQAQQIQGQVQGTEAQMNQVADEAKNLEGPGANEWFTQWLKDVPGYQQVAEQVAQQSTENLNRSIEEQTRLETQKAMSEAMNQFAGNGYSGAAQAALGQAAALPMAQAMAQMNQTKAGIQSNTFNQLAGQGQNLSFQGKQNEFSNAMESLMQALQGYGQVNNSQLGRLSGTYQNLGNISNRMNNLNANLTQISDPQFQTQDSNPFIASLLQGSANAWNIYKDPMNGFLKYTGNKTEKTIPNYGTYKLG